MRRVREGADESEYGVVGGLGSFELLGHGGHLVLALKPVLATFCLCLGGGLNDGHLMQLLVLGKAPEGTKEDFLPRLDN